MRLVEDPIEEFCEEGIVTKSGEVHECDVVIFATGFDLLHCLYPIYGRDKERHQHEIWGDEPRTFLGTTHPNLPNFFYLVGPGSGLGHNSIIYVTECQVNYNLDCIRKLLAANKADKSVKWVAQSEVW